ncbi:cytochrome c biogenesis protein ResB [Luteolibacter algae]|uniref:Cytochrome c biogenesis protein ResB n=1 Tax=Luteolibacter algae TaxID=454151 RepID=A0ABW5D7U4_9BACT
MTSTLRNSCRFLSSLRLTVTLLALSMLLIFIATIMQVELGIHEVQLRYFRAWYAWWDIIPGDKKFSIPLPGGIVLGGLLVINLLAAHTARFKLRWEKAGMILIHSGVLLLLLGEFFTGILGREAQMSINEGETKNYSTFPRDVELVVIEPSGENEETVTAIPQGRLHSGAVFPMKGFSVKLHTFYRNSEILPETADVSAFDKTRATDGLGKFFAMRGTPRETAMDRRDLSSAFVDIVKDDGTSIGRWLLSNALKGDQAFEIDGKTWKMSIRQHRLYHPFSIKLLDFSHDRYLGTNVPKNFSSKIRILNPETGEDREDLIYMNHPLRYQGLTFYQSGFDNNDETSIFQVVRNPAWTLPYIACAMVAIGLLWVFSQHLFKAIARRKAIPAP